MRLGRLCAGVRGIEESRIERSENRHPDVRHSRPQVVRRRDGGGPQAGRRRTAHRSAGRFGPGRCFQIRGPCGAPAVGRASGGADSKRAGLSKTDTITIPATSPDETRIGWVKHKELSWTQHKEGGLCRFLHFKPIPGERERTITLEPPAVLTGRLVSPAGEPLRNVLIDCDYETGYNSVAGFPQARTDAQGRFRYEIPGGGPFHVASRSRSFFSLVRDLTVQSGEQVDFGEARREHERPGSLDRDPKRIPPSEVCRRPPVRKWAIDPDLSNRPEITVTTPSSSQLRTRDAALPPSSGRLLE